MITLYGRIAVSTFLAVTHPSLGNGTLLDFKRLWIVLKNDHHTLGFTRIDLVKIQSHWLGSRKIKKSVCIIRCASFDVNIMMNTVVHNTTCITSLSWDDMGLPC